MEDTNKQKGVNGTVNTKVQPKQGAMPEASAPVEGEEKISIFKKWWFWAAIGGVVLLLVLMFLFLF